MGKTKPDSDSTISPKKDEKGADLSNLTKSTRRGRTGKNDGAREPAKNDREIVYSRCAWAKKKEVLGLFPSGSRTKNTRKGPPEKGGLGVPSGRGGRQKLRGNVSPVVGDSEGTFSLPPPGGGRE